MKNERLKDEEIELILKPETKLEWAILQEPAFRQGLKWGKPRFGHPEGMVVFHIREVLTNIEKLGIDSFDRSRLRLIAFVHDTFKYLEDKTGYPRDWSKHHAVYARRFIEKFTKDEAILKIVELHDEAFYCWRLEYLYKKFQSSESRLCKLLHRLGNDLQLYYLFFKCDTRTGDKNQLPLKWFECSVAGIEIIEF